MLITEIDKAYITIKRSVESTLTMHFLFGLFSLGFGLSFFFISDVNKPAFVYILSGLFVFAGSALLLNLPRLYKRINLSDGEIIFEATDNGILVAPASNGKENYYEWSLIEKVVLTNKARSNDNLDNGIAREMSSYSNGRWTVNNNIIIVYFRISKINMNNNPISNILNYIQKTPQGKYYTYSGFDPDEKQAIVNALRKFCPKEVKIESCQEVIFNYRDNTEKYVA